MGLDSWKQVNKSLWHAVATRSSELDPVQKQSEQEGECIFFSIFPLFPVSSYRVGLDVSIALEFRTSRTNGVIVATSNQARDGLGIEIVNGKVHNIQ